MTGASTFSSRPAEPLSGGYTGAHVLRRALGATVGLRVPRDTVVSAGLAAPQIAIDPPCALTALVDRPHDQRLPTASVTGGEHPVHRGRVRRDRLDVAARVLLDPELIKQL